MKAAQVEAKRWQLGANALLGRQTWQGPATAQRLGAAVALTASTLTVAPLSAQGVQLHYQVAPQLSCPSEHEFRNDVARRLGNDPFSTNATRDVFVAFRVAPDGAASEINWRSADGELPGVRHFDPNPAGCGALADDVAFAVTVQLQLLPDFAPPAAEEEATKSPAAPATTEQAVGGKPDDNPAPDGRSALLQVDEWRLGVGAAAVFGWAPSAAVRLLAFGAVRRGTFIMQAEGEWMPPARTFTGPASYELSAWTATLLPCFALYYVDACGLARGGRARARGVGLDQKRSPSAPVVQLGTRISWGSRLTEQLFASVHGEVVGDLTPVRIDLDRTQVWNSAVVTGSVGVALALSLR